MKKEHKKLKIIASPFVLVGIIFMIILCGGILIFIYSYPVARNQLTPLTHFICITFSALFPILAVIDVAYRGFLSVITIDNFGLKISVLSIFRVAKISWDEIYEIRYYERVRPFLFFSKYCLEDMPYNNIVKRKDVIQVELTKKVFQAIKSFTNKSIVNLTEDRIKLLGLET